MYFFFNSFIFLFFCSSGKLWDYVTPYFPSNIPKAAIGNTSHQGYSFKGVGDGEDDGDNDYPERDKTRKSSSGSNCSISTNLTTTLYCSQSSLSSDNENSYLELIRDYRSSDKLNLEISPKKTETVNNSLSSENIPAENLFEKILNYSKSEGALNVCDDDLVFKLSSDITLFNLVADKLESGRTCTELIEKWKKLDDLNCDLPNSDKIKLINDEIDLLSSNLSVPNKSDISHSELPERSNNEKTCIEIPDVQIDNLVENARKLLQSVDKTLMQTDNVVSRLDSRVDSAVDDIIKKTECLSSDCDFDRTFLNKSSINLVNKTNVLLKTENIGSNSSSPDSRISKSPAHSLCLYDTSKLHPPSPYSRVRIVLTLIILFIDLFIDYC